MIHGKYFITPHAVNRYIERINNKLSYNDALATIIIELEKCNNKPIISEQKNSHYLIIDNKFIAVVDKGIDMPAISTIIKYRDNFKIKKWYKWTISQELYLKLNYGKMTYHEMRKFMPYHSEKAISNKAVKLGLSDKRNWNPFECMIAIYYPNKIGEKLIKRNINALKIKRCRLIKSLSN